MAVPLLDAAPADAIPVSLVTASDWPRFVERKGEALARAAAASDFRGQAQKVLLLQSEGALAEAVLGLGDKPLPLAAGQLGRELPPGAYRLSEAPPHLDRTLIAIAWALGAYAFERYKPRRRPAPHLALPDGADGAEARRVANAVTLVRDLVNTAPQEMGPAGLHAAAAAVAEEIGARFEAIVGDELLAQNYPMIHAVGRAAAEAPRLLRLSWGAADAPRVALVGKGVTFDTGGLDLKTGANMRLMKKDMGGAAHALALGRLVAQASLPVRLDVWLPVVENAIGAGAFRPGDVLKTRKGLTVEIDNTDAEGRLILGDALARACEETPHLVLDYATLTGAARVALGPDLPPMYTPDETLAADLLAASAAVGDPIWRMPLWDPYEAELDSPIADCANADRTGMAGSITAALFLRKFVSAPAWAHFDIYAWSQKDRPGRPAGADAHALRASWEMLKRRFGG